LKENEVLRAELFTLPAEGLPNPAAIRTRMNELGPQAHLAEENSRQ